APHARMAAREAGDIAKPRSREIEVLSGIGARRELLHQRERKHVRQMTHRGKNGIVSRRIEAAHRRAAAPPALGDTGDRLWIGFGDWSQHDLSLAKQRLDRRGGAGMLRTGDGMTRNEARKS